MKVEEDLMHHHSKQAQLLPFVHVPMVLITFEALTDCSNRAGEQTFVECKEERFEALLLPFVCLHCIRLCIAWGAQIATTVQA